MTKLKGGSKNQRNGSTCIKCSQTLCGPGLRETVRQEAMTMKRSANVVAMAVILSLVAVLCTGPTSQVFGATRSMIIATAGTAGMNYPLGGAMASIWSSKIPGLTVTPQVTGGSIENTRLLDQKEVELGMQANSVGFFSYRGLEQFKGKPVTSIRAMASLVPEFVQIVVRADSGIKSLADLKGKRVAVGPPGSMEVINSRLILQSAGMSYDDLTARFVSYAEAANQFKDRLLDAVIFATGLGTSAIQDIASMHKISLVSLKDEEIARLAKEYPFFVPGIVPAGTYPGQDADVRTVTTKTTLVCREDLDANLVYLMLKTLFENLDTMARAHPMGKYITLETALDGLAIPLHPGAERFYKEKGLIK